MKRNRSKDSLAVKYQLHTKHLSSGEMEIRKGAVTSKDRTIMGMKNKLDILYNKVGNPY
jgi:hypothetical protein